MANRLTAGEPLDMSQALNAVAQAATAPAAALEKAQTVAVRMSDADYKRLKGLFGAQGLALARAGNLALFYLAEQLEAGRISVTKAGVIDRRG
jgi:hypothetical protein